jgi:colanic acid/amylovoran biosynthesis glycosyltransferase
MTGLLVGTLRFPYGTGESFLTPEIAGLARAGALHIVALHHRGEETHHGEVAQRLTSNVVSLDRSMGPRALVAAAAFLPATARSIASTPARRTVRSALSHSLVPEVRRAMNEVSATHLHAYWASLPASLMMAAAGRVVPWSFTAHRGDVALGWDLENKVRHASFVRCISDRTRSMLLDRVGDQTTNRSKIHVIPLPVDVPANPVDCGRLWSANGILAIGSLLPVKGHRYLVDAIAILRRRGHDQPVTFAGDGPLRAELQQHAQTCGVADLVTFLGQVPHETLLGSLQAGDYRALVLPSVDLGSGNHEGVPVAMLEAMAAGVPTIATETGGIPEALRDAGILVPGANADALASAISDLANESTVTAMSEAVRKRAYECYSVESVLGKLTTLMNVAVV